MNKRFSVIHCGPIAYADTLSEAQLIRQTINSQGFFILDGNKYTLAVNLTIYDSQEDKMV